MRIGHGFDAHKFGSINPLIISGVHIPFIKGGLLAHSDGDVVLHAVIDACLGAAALGSIGNWFSDDNSVLKNINSRKLLRYSWKLILAKGLNLENIDITIIAQEPKILPYIFKMRTNISEDLNCKIDRVNIKATTTDRLGFTGRIEGIACEAVVLLF